VTDFFAPYHSNVHLWYFGTMDFNVPAKYNDGGDSATIDATMRTNWWVNYERQGQNAGFEYSLLGGGNRLSTDHPLGFADDPAIVDGFNQYWNFGANNGVNRTALPSNIGTWPNIIKFDILGSNNYATGSNIATKLYYEYGGASANLSLQYYLDSDFNPYNTNSAIIAEIALQTTGAKGVYYYEANLPTTNVLPGTYSVYARISDGLHTRYLYAPQIVSIFPSLQPPVLQLSQLNITNWLVVVNGVAGQSMTLQYSGNLQNWFTLSMIFSSTGTWNYTNDVPSWIPTLFYRAYLLPQSFKTTWGPSFTIPVQPFPPGVVQKGD